MKWIKVPWGDLEVGGCCLLFFGGGVILGVPKDLSIAVPSLLVGGILFVSIGLWCALYSHGKEFDKLHTHTQKTD